MGFAKLWFVLLGFVLMFSCTKFEAPKYVGLSDVKISDIINDSITIRAGFNFYNSNRIAGKMVLNNLQAVVNHIDLGHLKSKEVNVPSKKEFTVPLEMKISYTQIQSKHKSFLNMIVNTLLSNEIKVNLKGTVLFKKAFIQKEYPIDVTKTVKLIK